MAVRGRKPKPAELRVIEGNPGKRTIPKVPKYAPLSERPPDELTRMGAALWRRLMKEFGRFDLVQRPDREQLIMLCDCWDVYERNMAIVREHGALIKSRSKNLDRAALTVNPAWKVARDALREFSQIAARFGLTPADRTRLGMGDPDPDDPDSFLELLT